LGAVVENLFGKIGDYFVPESEKICIFVFCITQVRKYKILENNIINNNRWL
jgi:hypothetical protein